MHTEVWFIRHGETIWNAEHRLQGQEDIELNDKGIEQASMLGKSLEPFFHNPSQPIIYSSDLKRAHKTAQLVAARVQKDVQITTSTKLREIHFGFLQGVLQYVILELLY